MASHISHRLRVLSALLILQLLLQNIALCGAAFGGHDDCCCGPVALVETTSCCSVDSDPEPQPTREECDCKVAPASTQMPPTTRADSTRAALDWVPVERSWSNPALNGKDLRAAPRGPERAPRSGAPPLYLTLRVFRL